MEKSWMVKYQQKCTTNTQVHPKLNHQPSMPVRPVHGRWRQEDQEFKTSLNDLRYYPTHSWDERPVKSPIHLLPTVCFIIPSASWDWDYDTTIRQHFNEKSNIIKTKVKLSLRIQEWEKINKMYVVLRFYSHPSTVKL